MLRLASRQRQLIRSEQLVGLGFSTSAISRHTKSRRLHRVHARVFALHPPPYSWHQRALAATFACGPSSMISDLSAAAHLRLIEETPNVIKLTVPTRAGRGLDGVRIHRRIVDRRDLWVPDGIPCTSAARTIIDCAHALGLEGTEQLIMAADADNRLNRRRLEELVAEHRGRPGVAHVRALITDDPPELRNENERRMFSICRQFGIERPLTNHRVQAGDRTFIADFCWPDLHLIVEADSWRWHGGRLATERDANRDQLLSVAGWRVVHFTRDQILEERERTGRRLLALTAGAA